MEQLKEEQESLEELVQNKIDSDIKTMYDEQMNKIESEADEQIKGIEETFTETKIAEMVANAIKTGIFEDLDGNLVNLKTALLEFADTSVEYMSVLGETLKTELLDNLGIALDTMEQLNEINKQLGNNKYNMSYVAPLNVDLEALGSNSADTQTLNNNISFGDTTITIQGNASAETTENIKQLLTEQKEQIIHEIMVNVK